MSTFVSVGNANQPFYRLLDAVCNISEFLPQPVFIQYGAAKDYICPECNCVSFINMFEFQKHIKNSELLIMHAGAGSVINAIQHGKIPVVIPRRQELGEHVDDHQVEFSHVLSETGKVLVVDDMNKLLESCKLSMAGQANADKTPFKEPKLIDMLRDVLDREYS